MTDRRYNYSCSFLMVLLLPAVIAPLSLPAQTNAPTTVEQLIANHERIQTLRCDIRRETIVGGRRMQTLSRVWYQRPDRLRVETVMPDPRRILVDGNAIYKWVDGHSEGVRIPLSEAPAPELMQVRKVPGTAEDYLLRLQDAAEHVLPATDHFPQRFGYVSAPPHPYAEIGIDVSGRLAQIVLFASIERNERLLVVDFSNWREPISGLFLPCLHESTIFTPDNGSITETVRVSALSVNQPIDASLFDVSPIAADIRFLTTDQMAQFLDQRD